jgi:O-acetyl-ADP-ribose deacetylase (regulator of RNase III)
MKNVKLILGDISLIEADVLVNAANNHLWMGSGVAGALKRRGGDSIEDEAISKGPIPVGSAVATNAGSLSAAYVIHGAVMGQDLRTDGKIVERTTRSCLELGLDLGVSSMALPAFGCGVGGMSYRKTAEAMLKGISSLDDGRLDDLDIIIVLFREQDLRVFRSVFDPL